MAHANKMIHTRIEEENYIKVKQLAELERRSVTAMINILVEEALMVREDD